MAVGSVVVAGACRRGSARKLLRSSYYELLILKLKFSKAASATLASHTNRTTLRSQLANREHIGLGRMKLLRNRHLYSLMCGKKKKIAIIGPALAGPAGAVPAPLGCTY